MIAKFKRKLAEFLILILSKLDYQSLKSLIVNEEVKINLKHYIPNDGQWHSFNYTVGFWIKFEKKIKKAEKFYIDGLEVKKSKRRKK